jgi:hypothetical protein
MSCRGDQHQPVDRGTARLLVTQTVDVAGPIPSEGAYSYVRVENNEGDKVAEERLRDEKTTITLDPGAYRMISYQRTCDGSCGSLDAASDHCAESFVVDQGQAIRASVRVTYGSGCTIRFASS